MKHKYFVVFTYNNKKYNTVIELENKIMNYTQLMEAEKHVKEKTGTSSIFIENLVYLGVE